MNALFNSFLVSVVLTASSGFLLLPDGGMFGNGGNRLEHYNVDHSQISVSGVSSGGAMATQIHVIFSSQIMGAGLIAGVPFACSGGHVTTATGKCMTRPAEVRVSDLISATDHKAILHTIDSTSNMAHDKVYIFNGEEDTVVQPDIGDVIKAYYEHYITNKTNIKTVFDKNAENSMPTDNYGGPCDQLSKTDFINNCNYSAAFHLLNHIYGGNLKMPTPTTMQNGTLKTFSQSEFFYVTAPSMSSMDTAGYIYIPTGCKDKSRKCKLHIAFHGCKMGQKTIGDVFVRHGGYNQVGELNDIIILYPQAIATAMNPSGCWDWWGYTGSLFDSHNGYQPTALKRMIDRVTG